MDRINQPSKEQMRKWLRDRQAEHTPPPDAAQIRRELGWKLTESTRDAGDVSRIRSATVEWNGTGK